MKKHKLKIFDGSNIKNYYNEQEHSMEKMFRLFALITAKFNAYSKNHISKFSILNLEPKVEYFSEEKKLYRFILGVLLDSGDKDRRTKKDYESLIQDIYKASILEVIGEAKQRLGFEPPVKISLEVKHLGAKDKN